MGLLKKLAELVIEFPDEEASQVASGTPGSMGSEANADVVDAIEKIRRDLEQSMEPDFSSEGSHREENVSAGESSAPSEPSPAPASASEELVSLPVVLDVAGVYQRAELTGKEFDIYKVETLMADQEVADLEPALRARMVRMTLKNLGKELTDILADAGKRDAALEAYLRLLEQQGAKLSADVERINARIQQEIDAFVEARTAVLKQNAQRLAEYTSRVNAFQDEKQAEEERLFKIAAPFVSEGANPVELG